MDIVHREKEKDLIKKKLKAAKEHKDKNKKVTLEQIIFVFSDNLLIIS
jgi:hypothetical protein